MKRFCIITAIVSLMVFAVSRSAVAGGGHHHGHHHGHHSFGHHYGHHSYGHHSYGHRSYGHHYGHHGIHIGFGYRHYSYPRYSYSSYSYPRYNYYRSPSCFTPTVFYTRPVVQRVIVLPPIQQIEKPRVDPPPQELPRALPLPPPPSSTRPSRGSALFTSLSSGKAVTTRQGVRPSPPSTVDFRYSTLSQRPIVSDDETPWVVGETSLPEIDNLRHVAVKQP